MGKDMVIYGSGGIVSELAQNGLIDEYRIFVAPIVLGRGKPLFSGISVRFSLRLLAAKTFRIGLVVLRYRPDKEPDS